MIVVGVVGAVVLILGCVLFMGSGSRKARRPAPATSGGRMTPEEARRLKREGKVELGKGAALFRQAGAFGSPGFTGKINEARGHLAKAMESFNKIPDNLGGPELEALSTECGRLLSACFKVPIEM